MPSVHGPDLHVKLHENDDHSINFFASGNIRRSLARHTMGLDDALCNLHMSHSPDWG